MGKYKKKPITIEAIQVEYDNMVGLKTCEPSPMWYLDALNNDIVYNDVFEDVWKVKTLEGDHVITDKDYIIQGVEGELYPCKCDIFEKTYDRVD